MKITHPSGIPYDLYPGTEVELTRYNPFFNELGEQSIPISIPSSAKNLQLLGRPERADNVKKPDSRINAKIQAGAFSVVARQAILSAQDKGSIETSFYLHEGAFYEKIEDITLAEIFEEEKISFANIDAAINFMYSLVPGTDPRFAVFSVFTDNYKLNDTITTTTAQGYYKFKNEVATEEEIDDKTVSIPKGFYITPFVKVKHVLQVVFAHLGYTLAPSFLDQAPFNNMVFLNDNLDTIIGNSINYIDIIPNISAKELFNVIRKFNVEFKPDEVNRIVYLEVFNDSLSAPASVDLSHYAVSRQIVNYHNQYKQLKLSSEQLPLPAEMSYLAFTNRRYNVSTGISEDQSLDFINILAKYPTSYLRDNDGYIVRDGFRADRSFVEKIAHLGIDYYAGGPLPVEEHSFPDVVPSMYTAKTLNPAGTYRYAVIPYVGAGRALQSKIVFSDEGEGEDVSNNSELKAMLCLFYNLVTHCNGTIYNYDHTGNKLWNYSIMWNGSEGIYEKFWRQRDLLLRNALLEIHVDAILPEDIKMSLSSVNPVLLHSQKYLISEINYSTKSRSIGSCSLLSTKLQTPLSESKPATEYFRTKTYKWDLKFTKSWTGIPGIPTVHKLITEPVAFYPPDPSADQYNAGGKYYQKTYAVEYGSVDSRTGEFIKVGDGTITVWLEAVLNS